MSTLGCPSRPCQEASMRSRLFVIVGAMPVGAAPVLADAFVSPAVTLNLTFPAPASGTFGRSRPAPSTFR